MNLRFHYDPDTGLPHIWNHGVTEQEVEEILRKKNPSVPGKGNSIIKFGQTMAGRYLKVIYSKDRTGDGFFVITSYELRGKSKKAFQKQQRRKQK